MKAKEFIMLVDAHCHLVGSYQKNQSLETILERAKSQDVQGFVVVGTDLQDSKEILEMTQKHACIQASLGVHPHEASHWAESSEAELIEMLKAPSARFVGETGLDYHYNHSTHEEQERAFRAQIRVAQSVKKPLMIHTREAQADTLRILKEENAEAIRGVFHCFSENKAFASKALDMGFYLSFSGILTFKTAQEIQEVAAWAPEDRILVETDSPFLAPVPHRGKTNEPAFVSLVATHLAQLRNCTLAHISDRTTENLEALCGWRPSC